jgi:glycosyltransferase involved in cell wall biosynthesis
MKILFVVQNYFPSVGGTQIFFQNLAERCANEYHDKVEVFTSDSFYGPEKRKFKRIEPTYEVINNVRVKRFSFFRFHFIPFRLLSRVHNKIFRHPNETLSRYLTGPWSPALVKAMRSTDADVIVAGVAPCFYMHYPLHSHKISDPKPFVFQGAIHIDESDRRKAVGNKTLLAIKESSCYLANTDFEKGYLVKRGVDQEKISVTGICVDVGRFAKGNRCRYRENFSLTDDKILVGYIGRIETTKNLEDLIRAIPFCVESNSELYFVIAGHKNPEYIQKLFSILVSFQSFVRERIFFVTDLIEEDKIDLFHALDIFVSPSCNESFGMVFLEAWSCKKPVIGSSIGAIRSVVSNEEDGLLFNPGNGRALSDKIITLATDKSLRRKMGEKGYEKTVNRYSIDAVTKSCRDSFIKARERFINKKEHNEV